jgi:predicted small lipoprotein YifL
MMVRRCTAMLLLVIGLALTGCGGALIPPSDEVTTRMNAKDEQALDDASPRHDAGATPAAPATSPLP